MKLVQKREGESEKKVKKTRQAQGSKFAGNGRRKIHGMVGTAQGKGQKKKTSVMGKRAESPSKGENGK